MATMTRTSNIERLELGYQSMDHFTVDTDDVADMLGNMNFCSSMCNNTTQSRSHR